MMEKIKNAMKNGLVKGNCDSLGATSVGSSSERSRSGSDEARTATGRAGRARRAVGGARGGAKAAAEPASRANVTFMLPAKRVPRRWRSCYRIASMAFVLPRSNAPARRIDGVDRDHNFLNCAANKRTERCALRVVPC